MKAIKMLRDAVAYPWTRASRLEARLVIHDSRSEAQRDFDDAFAEFKTELAIAFRPLLNAIERLLEKLTRWMS